MAKLEVGLVAVLEGRSDVIRVAHHHHSVASSSVAAECVVVLPVSQTVHNLGKRRSLHWNLVPAIEHQGIGSLWTIVRLCEQLAIAYHLDHFRVRAASVRLSAIVEDFPQTDTETPDVGLLSVSAEKEGIWRHPSNGQRLHLELVVVLCVVVFVLGDEIDADLDGQVVAHQDITRG